MKHVTLAVIASLAGVYLGCEQKTEPPPHPAPAEWKTSPEEKATGLSYEDEDFTLNALQPTICKEIGPMAPPGTLQRISVPIVVEGRSAREVPVGTLLFTLEDKQGHQFRPTLAGCGPSLSRAGVTAGQSIRGEVAFDVPQGVGALELTFEPFLIGRKKVTARVSVPSLTTAERDPESE